MGDPSPLHLLPGGSDADVEAYVVKREHLLELELHAERVKRARAELALLEAREAVAKANIGALYTENGAYELVGQVDGSTGVGRRRRRPVEGGSHG